MLKAKITIQFGGLFNICTSTMYVNYYRWEEKLKGLAWFSGYYISFEVVKYTLSHFKVVLYITHTATTKRNIWTTYS
jgi:hypothetical protein